MLTSAWAITLSGVAFVTPESGISNIHGEKFVNSAEHVPQLVTLLFTSDHHQNIKHSGSMDAQQSVEVLASVVAFLAARVPSVSD